MIKILAIDDIVDNLISLKAIIKDAFPDSILYTAQSGLKGIELAIGHNPDVILLDIVMPDMDGFEVCKQLKQDERVLNIPVVFLTSLNGDKTNRIKALEVGAEAFLSKPIDEIDLTAQIKAMAKIKLHLDQKQNEKERLAKLVSEQTLELQKSNELNRSLLQTIPFGMNIVDESGNILFISEKMKKLIGRDLFGQKCWMAYRDDQQQCPGCPLFKGIKIGETELYESLEILGGRTFQISHTGMMFEGKKAMLEIFQDITEKKEAEKKVKLLAHSLESISECVSITDNEDKIIYVNKSFIDTYGYAENELIGQPTSMLRPPDISYEQVRDILPQTLDGGWRGEITNQKKDGTLFPILLSTSIIKDDFGKPISLVGVAIDITEMKKSSEELLAAKEKAEESNRLKSAFLNNMSHEIRTPMNHIMGFSSLMAEANGEEKDAYADIILNSSNQLLILIENVIFLSRLQSEKAEIKKEEFSPYLLLNNIISLFDHDYLTNKRVINIMVPEEYKRLTILSDEDKINQIMTRLISNAAKYTFDGTIELGFEVGNGNIRFFVKDTGIGIPMDEQQKIFDSFYRSEQAISLVIGGTGLGLSIVKELVASLNGVLEVVSEPGKGSCFCFTLTIEPAHNVQNTGSVISHANKALDEITILVADDEPVNFLYLEILLKNKVKRLDHARNGKEAVEMALANNYDMILVDLKMPEMSGFEAAETIKQNSKIPVIAQTAYATTEDRKKAIKSGCDDLIAKPIKKEVLLEMIQKYA